MQQEEGHPTRKPADEAPSRNQEDPQLQSPGTHFYQQRLEVGLSTRRLQKNETCPQSPVLPLPTRRTQHPQPRCAWALVLSPWLSGLSESPMSITSYPPGRPKHRKITSLLPCQASPRRQVIRNYVSYFLDKKKRGGEEWSKTQAWSGADNP